MKSFVSLLPISNHQIHRTTHGLFGKRNQGSRNHLIHHVINPIGNDGISSFAFPGAKAVTSSGIDFCQQQHFVMQLPSPFLSIALESIFDSNLLQVAPQTACVDVITSLKASNSTTASMCVVVTEQGQPLGVLTAVDLLRFAASIAPEITTADLMQREFVTLKQSDFQDIFTIINLFNQHQIDYLLIIDHGQLQGVVTVASLCRELPALDFLEYRLVKEVMIEAIEMPATTLVSELVPLLVNSAEGVVITQATPEQILYFGSLTRDFLSVSSEEFSTLTAQSMMTPLLSIKPNLTLATAHQIMQQHGVEQLVVSSNELLGMITQKQILRSLDARELYRVFFSLQQQVEQLLPSHASAIEQKLIEQAATLQPTKTELPAQNSVEEELRQLNEELENRVQERTAQLMNLNEELVSEFGERVLAESALRYSEARFRAAAEGSLDAFFILESVRDESRRIVDFSFADLNSNGEKMIAMSRTEVLGKRASAIFPFNRNSLFFKKLVQVVETGTVSEEEIKVRLPNIKASWLHYQVVPLSDGIAITVRDISQRKQAQSALQESESTNRALLNAIPDLMFRLREDGTCLDFKAAKDDDLFINKGSFLEQRVEQLLPKRIAQQTMNYVKQALLTNEIQLFEIDLPLSSEIHSYEIRIAASRADEVLCLVRNITARKQAEVAMRQAEERYRSIFENSVKGLFQTTPTGQYLSANPALARIYGFNSPEQLIATLTDINQHFYVDINRRAKFLELMQTEGRVSHFESQVYRQDGVIIWISENAHVVFDAQGEPLYYEGSVVDTTERRVWEEALRYQQECTENLLLNILPEPIAERLKFWESTIADSFAAVTVLFADLVNFTEFSAQMPPPKLVALLNKIFSKFDQLAQKHGLEKIKTIGDAYMVVGGLPTPRADHTEAIAQMALEMQQEIVNFKRDNGEPFTLRIGIHTGPVVAGVIGIKKFAYDLWGDTVNVASRMESLGMPGHIQVTEAIYEQLQDKYVFEKRGAITVKGKGDLITYWLKGSKICHLRPKHS